MNPKFPGYAFCSVAKVSLYLGASLIIPQKVIIIVISRKVPRSRPPVEG